jgi:hypothetical protein
MPVTGLETILNDWNERQRANILNEFHALDLGASGRFERELEGVTETTGEYTATTSIKAAFYSRWLQDGRKPTSPGAPRGNPTLQEIILKWIDDKGLIPDLITYKSGRIQDMTDAKLSLSWVISQKIHREGYPQKINFYKVIETNSLKDDLDIYYVKEIRTRLWQSLQSQ